MADLIPKATSTTHLHLLAIVNTQTGPLRPDGPVRVLDAGCGNGNLAAYLTVALSALRPDIEWELFGFDVHDHGVQQHGFMLETLNFLNAELPGLPWKERIRCISTADPWPFPDGFFDVVVSNQVLEHVRDHARFFRENARVLRTGGFAVHLFPLGHYLYETHLNLPFVHWIGDHDLLFRYIRLLSRLGLGKYRSARRKNGAALDEYAERHADYLYHYTSYLSYREVLRLARSAGLRATFRYTPGLYVAKMRSLFHLAPRYKYRLRPGGLMHRLWTGVLKHVSCVTLLLENKETYRNR